MAVGEGEVFRSAARLVNWPDWSPSALPKTEQRQRARGSQKEPGAHASGVLLPASLPESSVCIRAKACSVRPACALRPAPGKDAWRCTLEACAPGFQRESDGAAVSRTVGLGTDVLAKLW